MTGNIVRRRKVPGQEFFFCNDRIQAEIRTGKGELLKTAPGFGVLEQLALRQVFDQPAVGDQEVVIWQLFQFDPAHIFEDAILDFAAKLIDCKELQIDCAAMPVVVANMRYARPDRCLDAQFFIELASQRRLRTFAGLNLASGELPLKRHRLIGPALADQDLVPAQHQCSRHQAQSIVARALHTTANRVS